MRRIGDSISRRVSFADASKLAEAILEKLATLQAENAGLRALIRHIWIHEGYRKSGYDQMTTEQKALHDSIVVGEKGTE